MVAKQISAGGVYLMPAWYAEIGQPSARLLAGASGSAGLSTIVPPYMRASAAGARSPDRSRA
jgi:hypothetical protein